MKSNYGRWTGLAAILNGALIAAVLHAPSLSARTLGLVADDATRTVTVFDADTDSVVGSVFITSGGFGMGDVLITPDQTRGFVTNFNGEVFVIDLTTSPPRLAGGRNPIPVSNNGAELAISPDGKFLLVSDGGVSESISVIEIASQTEINTLIVGSDTTSIEVCSDGSVLATSVIDQTVRRLTLSDTGALTDTGERLSFEDGPNNVVCAPDGMSGLVIIRDYPSGIQSFRVPGLEAADARPLSGTSGISGLVNPVGDRIYVRNNGDFVNEEGFVQVFGAVDVFDYNAATAALGAAPLFSIPVAYGAQYYGMDQMALHPQGAKLYVSEPNALNVYDANTGDLLNSITDSNIVDPTGVTVSAVREP
jgi:DNA-binding beta-propeller fold protein YncE